MSEIKPDVFCGSKVWGHVKVTRRNVLTNEIDLVIDKKNTLLYSWLNGLFTNGNKTMIGASDRTHKWLTDYDNTVMYGCAIGTNSTPPTRTDTFDQTRCLAYVTTGETVARSEYGISPVSLTRKWVFPAGIGTGTLNEVFLTTYSTGLARQVFQNPVEKTAYHELTVEWTLNLSGGATQGEILNGQRDGQTAVRWKTFINNRLAWAWANGFYSDYGSSSMTRPLFRFAINPAYYVILGSSNDDSDLALDAPFTLKGTKIWEGYPVTGSNYAYTNGNCYRDIRVGLDTAQGNGAIGEMLVVERFTKTAAYSEEPICRITFTPALDKVDTYQLFMDLRIGLNLS